MGLRRTAASDGNQKEIVAAGAGLKTCKRCGTRFKSYDKSRIYCTHKCYGDDRAEKYCAVCNVALGPKRRHNKTCSRQCMMKLPNMRPKKQLVTAKSGREYRYNPRPRTPNISKCGQCGQEYKASPSKDQKYCSYPCFLASGGAIRAGYAAAMAKSKYGAKKDANHNEIFEMIGKFTAVKDLSAVGCGVPDGIAWVNGGWQLFDVKNPKTGYGKRGLNARQKKWSDDWRGGPVYLLYTVEEALRFAKGDLENIKRHDPADEALQVIGAA